MLDHLWSTLGIRKTLTRLVGGTRRDAATERVVFALVANRALAPSSKLAAAAWVGADVHIPGLPEVSDDACYRAMDWLLAVEPELGRAVYDQVADLLNLEVDLLFFDTTSTYYFETESADAPVWRESTGQRVDTDAQTLAADDPPPVRSAGRVPRSEGPHPTPDPDPEPRRLNPTARRDPTPPNTAAEPRTR